ncbi:hypothetical protein OAN47_03025 [Planctomycetota bacterium]|nr:hypothetical protein [Planctomycetota bacterium]
MTPYSLFLYLSLSLFSSIEGTESQFVNSSPIPNSPVISDDLLKLVQDLGSDDWIVRDEATHEILEAGSAAVAPLRSCLNDPDPEVRERVRELLSILSPNILTIDVLRLGKPVSSKITAPFSSAKTKSLAFRSGGIQMSTIQTGTEERRFQITLRGSSPPYLVEILFHGTSSSSMTGPPPFTVVPGIPYVVLTEDRVVSESASGKTITQNDVSTWAILLNENMAAETPNESTSQDSEASTLERIKTAIHSDLNHQPKPETVLLASQWRAVKDWPLVQPDSEDELGDAWRVAQLIQNAEGARRQIESRIEKHLSGELSLSSIRIDRLIPFALEENLTGSVDLFSRHCADLSTWSQHLIWNCLDRKIKNNSFETETTLKILRALLRPESLAALRWSNSHMASLWSSLSHSLPLDRLNSALANEWDEILGEDLSQSTGRIPLFFATMAYLSNRDTILEGDWIQPTIELMATQYAESALGVILEQDRLKSISDEHWSALINEIDRGLKSTDTTISLRVRNSARKLSEYQNVPEKYRMMFVTLLVNGLLDYNGSQRSVVDQILTRQLGTMPRKTNNTRKEDYWEMRSKQWKERMASPIEEIAETEEAPRWIQLTMADVRVAGSDIKVLGLQRLTIPTDVRYHALGDDGHDASIYLENSAGGSIRFSGSMLLMIDRPTLTRWRTRWRNWTYRFSSARLGAESAMVRSSVLFQTLLIVSETEPPEDGLIQKNDVAWEDVEDYLISALDPDSSTDMYMTTDIISTLRLERARPRLGELWEEKQTVSLARALLSLGDNRGRPLLRKTVLNSRSRLSRDSQKALEDLMKVGDPETLESVLGWLEAPEGQRVKSIESQMPMLLRYLESFLIENPNQEIITEHRLLGALIMRTDHRNNRNSSIPMLRRLTGLDLGWWNTYSITDMNERYKVQEDVGGLWRAWWDENSEDFKPGIKSAPLRNR